jgi:hypothetical protein
MNRILRGLWIVYLCVGAGLYFTSLEADDATVLQMTATGHHCNRSAGHILVWPLFLKEFNLGGLRPGGLGLC